MEWSKPRTWPVRPQTWLEALAVGFSLLVRLGSLRPVNNPDAVYKWVAAAALVTGVPLPAAEFDHHAARLGVTVPTAVCQLLFGDATWVYYLPILGATSLLALLTYRVGSAMGGRWVGAVAVALYTPLPCMSYVGSQLLPELFQSAGVMGTLLALIRARQKGSGRQLGHAALWFFWAYLCKESVVLFLPGILVAVWLARKRAHDVIAFLGLFALGVALETLAYRLTYGFAWGRATIVLRHHLVNPRLRPPIESLSDLFSRYLELQPGFRELFYGALVACVLLAWPRSRVRLDASSVWAVLSVCGSFFLFSTFALRSLDPPRLLQPLNERYLYAAAPFLALLVVSVLSAFANVRSWARRENAVTAAFAVGCCALGASLWVSRSGQEHALTTMLRAQVLLRQSFDDGVPIVNPEPLRHATGAALGLFLSAEQSRHARVAYPGHGRTRARVIVDGHNPKFRHLSKRALTRSVAHWRDHPHVVVRMKRGFSATLRRGRTQSNELRATR